MAERPGEIVVLVNGLWAPQFFLTLLARRLRAAGFTVYRFSYPTVSQNLQENAARLQAFVQSLDAPTVHFVAHSLGGLVVRALWNFYPQQRPGWVITLGTPHNGSRAAAGLARHAWGRRLLGRSMQDLLRGLPQTWPVPVGRLAVVAGSVGFGLGGLFARLPKPHDGTVAVDEAQLAGASHTLHFPVSHFGLLLSRRLAQQLCHFLRQGHFNA